MPLIRKPPTPATELPARPSDTAAVCAALASVNDDERWTAARTAAELPESVPALGAALARETNKAVRQAMFSALARIATSDAAQAVLPFLRSDDALLRTEASDALVAMRQAAWPHILGLLRDGDADVRILGCTLLREIPTETAAPICCELLDTELEPNVCAAIVDAVAELGHASALPALTRCAERFRRTPFLEFAIRTAIDRIRSQANARA